MTFRFQNGFPGLIVNPVYVKSGDPGCIGFEISCEQTNKQTNQHINAAEHPTHTTVIGVVKNIKKKEQRQPLLLLLLYYHVQFLLNRPSFLDDCSVLLHC